MKIDIAILGATGAVGEAMLSILEERKFPVGKLYPLASHRSAGNTVLFNKRPHAVLDVENFDFSKVQIAFFSAGGKTSAQYVPKAVEAGCVVIDNTSHFRMDKDVPLIIPEVNAYKIEEYKFRNIIANPNCSTIQMLVALKPIYDAVGIRRINVATYQSVSGAGRSAVSELVDQVSELLNGRPVTTKAFSRQIAFNVLPQIDTFQENGYTREEMKMHWETQKIFDDPNIMVNATAVRVPVLYGHSEAINIETTRECSAAMARDLLREAPGVILMDDLEALEYPTPIPEASGTDAVYVGRVREDFTQPRSLNLWVVSDNLRKGAALNAVQIAEILVNDYFI